MKTIKGPTDNSMVRGIAMAGNMSMTVGVMVFLGILVGNYLDEKLGGKGVVFAIVLLLSVGLGFYSAIRTLLRGLDKDVNPKPPEAQE